MTLLKTNEEGGGGDARGYTALVTAAPATEQNGSQGSNRRKRSGKGRCQAPLFKFSADFKDTTASNFILLGYKQQTNNGEIFINGEKIERSVRAVELIQSGFIVHKINAFMLMECNNPRDFDGQSIFLKCRPCLCRTCRTHVRFFSNPLVILLKAWKT